MDPLIVRTDGGLATTLQAHGLPRFHPVEPWLWQHPERIVAAHRAFIEAGSELVLAASFLAHTTDEPIRTARRAIELARRASDTVWLSVGPGRGQRPIIEAVSGEVDGVVLETFADPEQAIACLGSWTRDVPTVVSCVPLDDRPWTRIAMQTLEHGAVGFGFNCVSGPDMLRAVRPFGRDIPLWLKPNGGPDFAERYRRLEARATWLGGCCGVSPADLSSLRSAD